MPTPRPPGLALLSSLVFPPLPSHPFFFFFLNDTATPEISPLSLPAALPIWRREAPAASPGSRCSSARPTTCSSPCGRSEEHTSELQSRLHLVCRLLL